MLITNFSDKFIIMTSLEINLEIILIINNF